MGRVGGDDQNRGANPREKDRDDGAASRLAHTTFASHKDPLERLLVQYVLHGSLWQICSHLHSFQYLPLFLSPKKQKPRNLERKGVLGFCFGCKKIENLHSKQSQTELKDMEVAVAGFCLGLGRGAR